MSSASSRGGPRDVSFQARMRKFTPTVAWLAIYLTLATLNFGYDVGTFSGVQAMTPFGKRFGVYDETTQNWALPPYLSSIMNSTPFIGKLIGAMTCGPVAERWGRRVAVAAMACISLVGVTLQTSATTAAQFTIGRIINFAMTGFCIVVTPIYQSECMPAELRGMITGTIQFMILFGQVISSLVNFGTSEIESQAAWQIPIGLQFVVPVLMLVFLPLMPESPRWLISKGRKEQARRSLHRLRNRKNSDVDDELEAELVAWEQFKGNDGKGGWKELFDERNKIRTIIAILVMFFQQVTGQAFVSQYQVAFYKAYNIGDPFLLNVIGALVGLVTSMSTLWLVDAVGRRPLLLTGATMMCICLFALAGLGTVTPYTTAQRNGMAAFVMLFGAFYGLSWAPVSYIILGEVASSRVKEKTNNLAVSISVLTTFIVSFTVPYLLYDANLGPKVGYVYGAITVVSVVVAYFFVPELKGRSLEEVDQLFASSTPIRKFKNVNVESVELVEVAVADLKGKNEVESSDRVEHA